MCPYSTDKKNRCRRRRLADAWRLGPGEWALESPRYVFIVFLTDVRV
jgi:hypothetical protein